MRLLRWPRRPAGPSEADRTGSRAAAEQARAEVARSRERHQVVTEQVIGPLTVKKQRNQFADMINRTLIGDGR